jgi:hypothetical protein
MARPIRNIEIYLPLDFNDGRPIPESKYVAIHTWNAFKGRLKRKFDQLDVLITVSELLAI